MRPLDLQPIGEELAVKWEDAEDTHIRLWLNGVLTADYTEDEKDIPMNGRIGLQIHGGGKAEASYKDITIEEL